MSRTKWTYEIVDEKHWYIDLNGDLIDIDALARNGPSRIEVPTTRFQQTLEIEPARIAPLDKSGHYSYPIAL
jgi:hypothetical protein